MLNVSTVLDFPFWVEFSYAEFNWRSILRILPFPMLGDLGESIYIAAYRINVINQMLVSIEKYHYLLG